MDQGFIHAGQLTEANMVSLIILLLGLFTAGLIIGVFLMTLMEFKQLYGMRNRHPDVSNGAALTSTRGASSADQS